MNHTEILNHLAQKHNLTCYLEIGVQNPDTNFNKITCKDKKGVDPAPTKPQIDIYVGTSDEFFDCPCSNDMFFDLSFIDGLHEHEQVRKDFDNVVKRTILGGYIVLHDCNPTEEIWTCQPRGSQKMWTGDVYKFASTLKGYTGIEFHTVDTDFGCCIVKITGDVSYNEQPITNWHNFVENRADLLNLITVEQFKEMY